MRSSSFAVWAGVGWLVMTWMSARIMSGLMVDGTVQVTWRRMPWRTFFDVCVCVYVCVWKWVKAKAFPSVSNHTRLEVMNLKSIENDLWPLFQKGWQIKIIFKVFLIRSHFYHDHCRLLTFAFLIRCKLICYLLSFSTHTHIYAFYWLEPDIGIYQSINLNLSSSQP